MRFIFCRYRNAIRFSQSYNMVHHWSCKSLYTKYGNYYVEKGPVSHKDFNNNNRLAIDVDCVHILLYCVILSYNDIIYSFVRINIRWPWQVYYTVLLINIQMLI